MFWAVAVLEKWRADKNHAKAYAIEFLPSAEVSFYYDGFVRLADFLELPCGCG